MYVLITSVIGIGLMTAATVSALNYVPSDALERKRLVEQSAAGFHSLEDMSRRYLRDLLLVNPEIPLENVMDAVPVGNAANILFPAYGFKPTDVRSTYTWDVIRGKLDGLDGIGICLRPLTNSAVARDAFPIIKEGLPPSSTYQGATCGSTVNDPNGNHLTYWVLLNHVA